MRGLQRLFALCLAIVLASVLVACGPSKYGTTSAPSNNATGGGGGLYGGRSR